MFKKIMLLGAAIAALVAIAAPAAQAVELVDGGGALKEKAKVTATSTNLETVVTGVGTLKCSLVTVHAEVTKNGPTEVHLKGLSTTVSGCTVPITDPTVTTLVLNNTDGGSATGVYFFADGLNCDLGGSLGVGVETETNVLSVAGSLKGTCGEGHMKGNFLLETTGGEEVLVE